MELPQVLLLASCLIFALLMAISGWKIFVKAHRPGWTALIPIYNILILLEIVRKPPWWIFLMAIPLAGLFFIINVLHRLSVAFGYGFGTTMLLVFLPFFGYPVLGFGHGKYDLQRLE